LPNYLHVFYDADGEDPMPHTLEKLEALRDNLRRRLFEMGDFRPGSVCLSYRKCGKKNCACAKTGHPGHPQYLRTKARGGKNRAETIRMGPELEKAIKEAENYQQFMRVNRELVESNEQICQLRPVEKIKDPKEFEALKKKLQKHFVGRQKSDSFKSKKLPRITRIL
jgi:hypothetical protein